MKKKSGQQGPDSFRLIEEALHLVRRLPVMVLVRYFAATALWSFGFLLFWSYTTWFAPAGPELMWSVLALTFLYVLLKAAQADFCARLWEARTAVPTEPWTWGNFARLAVSQLRLQAWGLVFVPLAAAVTLPLAWVFGFFQSVTVLGHRAMNASELRKEAWTLTLLWPGQQHYALAILSVIAASVWLNLASAFYALPWMANHLLGIENFLGISGWQMFNTTFLASVSMLTWMAMDPLVKAFYTLRVFYGQSLRTGDDLRMEIGLVARRRLRKAGVAVLLLLLVPRPAMLDAAEKPVASAVKPVELDQAIDEVLAKRDFQWRLRPQIERRAVQEEDGVVKRFVKQGFKIIGEMARSVRSAVQRFEKWIKSLFPKKETPEEKQNVSIPTVGGDYSVLRVFLYLLMAIVVGLILWVVYLMVRQGNRQLAEVRAAGGRLATPVNLMDENVQAALLPEDGWLALAREQMQKGEWRLALRALYLAHLARLGAEGLVVLTRFKTNLDYERELRRRAAGRGDVIERFAGQRLAFECVWYGRELAREETVRRWFDELKGAQPA